MTTRKKRIEQVIVDNRARAQLHRWWAFHERAPRSMEHVHALVAEDFAFKAPLGEIHGKKAYSELAERVLAETRYGHQLGTFTARADGSGVTRSEATFITQSYTEKDGLVSSEMSYAATLTDVPKGLPVFTSLTISPGAEVQAPLFVDTYPLNRVLATVFAWFAPLEDVAMGAEALRELVVPEGLDMRLGPSAEPITSFDGIKSLFDTNFSALARNGHWIHGTRVTETARGRFRLQCVCDWEAIRHDGQAMAAKSLYDWGLVDTGERFARIQRLHISMVEPFHPVED